jgi:hypothetical protein
MHEIAASPFESWANFYVIVGSSAGALTGLQFVVLTLIAEVGAMRGRDEALAAFGSPNVVHFCTALLVAAVACAPWGTLWLAGIPMSLVGFGGLLYSIAVLRRARRQTGYRPVLEDWIWHNALPMLAYFALALSGMMLRRVPRGTSFLIAAADLLLVFIGIHNAWDTVTYVTSEAARRDAAASRTRERKPAREPDS